MPADYPIPQMIHDMMAVIMQGSPYIVAAGIVAGACAFVLAWFFYAVRIIVDWPFKR